MDFFRTSFQVFFCHAKFQLNWQCYMPSWLLRRICPKKSILLGDGPSPFARRAGGNAGFLFVIFELQGSKSRNISSETFASFDFPRLRSPCFGVKAPFLWPGWFDGKRRDIDCMVDEIWEISHHRASPPTANIPCLKVIGCLNLHEGTYDLLPSPWTSAFFRWLLIPDPENSIPIYLFVSAG